MDFIKKVFALLSLIAWVMCIIGGAGYSIYSGSWVIAIACVWTGVIAFPKIKEIWKSLIP